MESERLPAGGEAYMLGGVLFVLFCFYVFY
jgi:hypothetical protein